MLKYAVAWVAAVLTCMGAVAATPTVADLFRDQTVTSATLSPNGRYLALTMAIPDAVQLQIMDLKDNTSSVLLRRDDTTIGGVQWLNDDYLQFQPRQRNQRWHIMSGSVFILHRNGGQVRYVPGRIISRDLVDDPNHVITVRMLRDGDIALRRVNLENAFGSEVEYLSERIPRDFVVDRKGMVRVVQTSDDADSKRTIWYHGIDGSPWRKLATFPRFNPDFDVLGVDGDDRTLWVSARDNKGLWGIHTYDFDQNRPGPRLASDPLVDVRDDLVYAPDTHKVLGVRVPSDPPRTVWFDTKLQTLQQQIDAARPGLINVIRPGKTGAAWLVASYSFTQPVYYSLYDHQTRKLKQVALSRPTLDTAELAPVHVYDYVARDGLPIMAYLTLPKGRAAKGLPLVVLVHNGPWDRDTWGFDPEVQFLASMGYAVLQPQYRGSVGFGDSHENKGFQQFGLAMQDDLTDGVLSLTRQGVVDAKRVSIMGYGGYAGYAALMGVVKDPDQYRCAIDLFGLSNLFEIASTAPFNSRSYNYSAETVLGDPKTQRDQLTATSPNLQAAKIRAPVLMVYGDRDVNHGVNMRAALEKADKVHEYLRLSSDDVGLRKDTTRIKVYGAIEAFLRKYNPP